jgi:hypothetical protein
MKSGKAIGRVEIYALAFGLFLGLAILKFGNPVILDNNITPPGSASDFLHDAWPIHWANWIFFPLALAGAGLAISRKAHWPGTKWLWMLPLLWFGWQILSACQTVDAVLTTTTLWQFSACTAGYFLGAFLFNSDRILRWLLIGVLAAFAFCLVKGIDQRNFEYPESRQLLIQGQACGWTNLTSEIFGEMKHSNIIITTNGVDVANPAILAKFAKGRVSGTMVYPNALAGLVLLLFPVSVVLAFQSSSQLRTWIRIGLILITLFLGLTGFFWTGSKLGWLIAIAAGGACLFRLKWPVRLKWLALILFLVLGLSVFAVRFHNYFAAGATSVGARFDYWHAAGKTTLSYPWFGTGPGTFQRPYAKLKAPNSEMARLTHNDYLQQFSDSGILGGIFYTLWILIALAMIGQQVWFSKKPMTFAIFLGLTAWFIQGIGEFELYIPALAWTAFTLMGSLINQIDKPTTVN